MCGSRRRIASPKFGESKTSHMQRHGGFIVRFSGRKVGFTGDSRLGEPTEVGEYENMRRREERRVDAWFLGESTPLQCVLKRERVVAGPALEQCEMPECGGQRD